MRRQLARFLFVFVIGIVAMILGVVTSMTLTPPGRDLLARTVSTFLDRIVLGQVRVGCHLGLVPVRPHARKSGGARHQRRVAGGPAPGAGRLPAAELHRRPGGVERDTAG